MSPRCWISRASRFASAQPPPSTWIPFGAGARRCVGAHVAMPVMSAVLTELVAGGAPRPVGPPPQPVARISLRLDGERRLRWSAPGAVWREDHQDVAGGHDLV